MNGDGTWSAEVTPDGHGEGYEPGVYRVEMMCDFYNYEFFYIDGWYDDIYITVTEDSDATPIDPPATTPEPPDPGDEPDAPGDPGDLGAPGDTGSGPSGLTTPPAPAISGTPNLTG